MGRAFVAATSERRRSAVAAMSERRRSDVAATSERCRSDVDALSQRCRNDVADDNAPLGIAPLGHRTAPTRARACKAEAIITIRTRTAEKDRRIHAGISGISLHINGRQLEGLSYWSHHDTSLFPRGGDFYHLARRRSPWRRTAVGVRHPETSTLHQFAPNQRGAVFHRLISVR